MEQFEIDIKKAQADRVNAILSNFIENDIEKGLKANIGEVRDWKGKKYKKQTNGKWLEVSEHSKNEDQDKNKLIFNSLKDIKLKLKKEYDEKSKNHDSLQEKFNKIAQKYPRSEEENNEFKKIFDELEQSHKELKNLDKKHHEIIHKFIEENMPEHSKKFDEEFGL